MISGVFSGILCFIFPLLLGFMFFFGDFLSMLLILENFNLLCIVGLCCVGIFGSIGVEMMIFIVYLTVEVMCGLSILCCIYSLNGVEDIFIL
uniref:NADH dehydrogenase subunit 4L n=1 Tax=Sindiplozoon sp. DZ-2018 TaxID=2340795 RepID=A0A386PZ54_9PLAT|nr:NADH dehydrogenase subunit 4L [Sindiplozoon sp. DZ-2018]